MTAFLKSAGTAVLIAAAIQSFTVGVLAPKLPREVCRPGVRETRSLTLPKSRLVSIENVDGAITVTTHERDVDAVDVNVYFRAYTPSSETKTIAEQYLKGLLKVDSGDEEIRLVTEPGPRPDEVDLCADYTVTVPEGTDIQVAVTNGNVRIGPGCGRVEVTGNISDVDILDPQGVVEARSNIGRIGVVEASENTRLKTVNGNIVATMKGGSLEAATTNGHVYATLTRPEVIACDLTVMNGNITLVMSKDCSARIDASTQRGTVTSAVLAQGQSAQGSRELRDVIGAGRTSLTMRSLNGNIWISRIGP